MKLPRWILYSVLILVVLSWVPIVLIMRARVTTSTQPRIHVVPDMDSQPKYKPQSRNPLFADRRAMRPPVAGTVAWGTLAADPAQNSGRIGDDWVTSNPLDLTTEVMQRGRER